MGICVRQTGLSTPHAYVLRMVLSEPGISQKQLAEELHLDPSTVTRFVDTLAASAGASRYQPHQPTFRRRVPDCGRKTVAEKRDKIGEVLFLAMQTRLGDKYFRGWSPHCGKQEAHWSSHKKFTLIFVCTTIISHE